MFIGVNGMNHLAIVAFVWITSIRLLTKFLKDSTAAVMCFISIAFLNISKPSILPEVPIFQIVR